MTGGTLTYNGSVYDNPFNPPASLTLAAGAGAGPFVFANSNAYRGGTTVNSGATLRVTNTIGSGTGPGAVAVNSGGTLQGTGSIFPAAGNGVTVASGATLQPGTPTAAGTLTVGTAAVPSSVNLSGTYLWNNSNAGTSSSTPGGSGGTVSLLAVNGGLTFAPQTFSINGLGTPNFNNAQPYSWTVSTASGAIALGPQPSFLFTPNFAPATGGVYSLSTSGGAVFLNYSPVPEPTFIVLTCAGIAGAGTWWRRRTTRRA
jgi:fibronectin-binding autotransporter adhesin